MYQRLTCQAPAVCWVDPEDRAGMPDADVVTQEVVRLMHDIWWRLPRAVRAVVASRLNGVRVGYSEGGLSEEYAEGDLTVDLAKDGVSGAGRAKVVSILVWGSVWPFWRRFTSRFPWRRYNLKPPAAHLGPDGGVGDQRRWCPFSSSARSRIRTCGT